MKKIIVFLLTLAVSACTALQSRKAPASFDQVPLAQVQREAERWRGRTFEGRFKFYHIYHGPDRPKGPPREQRTPVPTHFTARAMSQPGHVVRIRLTPSQEAQFKRRGIRRQDVIGATVRFAGLDPDGGLAFELLEVTRW